MKINSNHNKLSCSIVERSPNKNIDIKNFNSLINKITQDDKQMIINKSSSVDCLLSNSCSPESDKAIKNLDKCYSNAVANCMLYTSSIYNARQNCC